MRLRNITVDEVSLVDKAANKRKFAICKRDEAKEIVKEEVKEAQKVIEDDLTPEQLEVAKKILTDITELAALVKKG